MIIKNKCITTIDIPVRNWGYLETGKAQLQFMARKSAS